MSKYERHFPMWSLQRTNACDYRVFEGMYTYSPAENLIAHPVISVWNLSLVGIPWIHPCFLATLKQTSRQIRFETRYRFPILLWPRRRAVYLNYCTASCYGQNILISLYGSQAFAFEMDYSVSGWSFIVGLLELPWIQQNPASCFHFFRNKREVLVFVTPSEVVSILLFFPTVIPISWSSSIYITELMI